MICSPILWHPVQHTRKDESSNAWPQLPAAVADARSRVSGMERVRRSMRRLCYLRLTLTHIWRGRRWPSKLARAYSNTPQHRVKSPMSLWAASTASSRRCRSRQVRRGAGGTRAPTCPAIRGAQHCYFPVFFYGAQLFSKDAKKMYLLELYKI